MYGKETAIIDLEKGQMSLPCDGIMKLYPIPMSLKVILLCTVKIDHMQLRLADWQFNLRVKFFSNSNSEINWLFSVQKTLKMPTESSAQCLQSNAE